MHALPALAFALATAVCIWFVTAGAWRLFDPEDFGQFYDFQGESFVHGRWDVPPAGIGFEAFIHNGKTYGYFGFAPALARLVLNALFPAMWGRWSRLSLVCGFAFTLIYTYLFRLEAGRLCDPKNENRGMAGKSSACFVLWVGLGTTLIFLAGRAFVYHEAILWGSALAIGCAFHAARYLRGASSADVVAACTLSFLSFFSRMSVGSGTTAMLLLLAAAALVDRRFPVRVRLGRWRTPPPLWHPIAAITTVAIVTGLYICVNQSKFGTLLDGMPFRYYNQVEHDPPRMKRTGGRAVSLCNLRSNVDAYFSPASVQASRHFPWIWFATAPNIYPESKGDIVEPFCSLTAASPGLTLLAGIGTGALVMTMFRRNRGAQAGGALIPSIGAVIGAGPVLISAGISYRYLHDLFPALVILSAMGHARLLAISRTTVRRSLAAAVSVLAIYSIFANVALTLEYQRTIVWHQLQTSAEAAEQRDQFMHWQRSIDACLGVAPGSDSTLGSQNVPVLK